MTESDDIPDDWIARTAKEIASHRPGGDPTTEHEQASIPVAEKTAEGTYVHLRLEPGHPFEASYVRPGQYTRLQLPGTEPRYIVIANSPERADRDGWEFLVEPTESIAAALDALQVGDDIKVGHAEGSGYPRDFSEVDRALIFVTGSGVAAARPVIQHWADHPDTAPERARLYYGESKPDDYAYRDELVNWAKEHGIVVEQAAETHESPADGFRYVQDIFKADKPELDGTAILLCGSPTMMRIVAEIMLRLRVPEEQIFTNV